MVGSVYGISTLVHYSMPNPIHTYIYIYIYHRLVGCLSWHINPCTLFNAKSCLYIYIYIYHRLVGFHGISTLVHYSMQNPVYTYIYIIGRLVGWLVGWFSWHINPCTLFNAKSCLYMYIYIS